MSRAIALAEEIAARLNDPTHPWQGRFLAQREYVPDWREDKELADLQVAVIPERRTAGPFERERLRVQHTVLICVAQRLRDKSREELDGLLQLVEEVIESLALITLEAEGTVWTNLGWEERVAFAPEMLARESTPTGSLYAGSFLSVIATTWLLLE